GSRKGLGCRLGPLPLNAYLSTALCARRKRYVAAMPYATRTKTQCALFSDENDRLPFGHVRHCARVHAVALVRRRRPVGEDVAEVAVATRATNFDAHHAVGAIFDLGQRVGRDRLGKRWPTGARFEFGPRTKERIAAAPANICAGFFRAEEATAERALG